MLLKEEFELVLFRATLAKLCSTANDHRITNDHGTANNHGIANNYGTANDHGSANDPLKMEWHGYFNEAVQTTNS